MRIKTVLTLVVLIGLLMGCDSEQLAAPSPTVSPSPSPSVTASPNTSRQAQILYAELADRPARWREVLFIPFGDGSDELGYDPPNESAGLSPASFAATNKGFWIMDNEKSRILRVERSGRLVESIPLADGYLIRDIAVVGGRLWAIVDETRGLIGRIGPNGITHKVRVHDDPLTYYPWYLYSNASQLMTYVIGNIEPEPAGIQALMRVDEKTGRVEDIMTGFPTRSGLSINTGGFNWQSRFDVSWYEGDHELSKQRFRIQIRRRNGATIPTISGVWIEATSRDSAAAFVYVSSNQGGEGGAWYLGIPSDRTKDLIFERLPRGAPVDESRHLATDEDGNLYLMVAYRDGLRIFQR